MGDACGVEVPSRSEARARRPLRVRLSLRWLMVAVLALGGGLGWYVRGVRAQRDAIAAVERAGGSFFFDDMVDAEGYNRAMTRRTRPAWQQWIARSFGDDFVRTPRILFLIPPAGSRAEIDPETWRAILSLPGLTSLHLIDANLDDARLAGLVALSRLRLLRIDGNARVTNAGAAALGGLRQLRHLNLSRTGVDDGGMVHLETLTGLQDLELSETRVGAAGLAHLKGLRELRHLHLNETPTDDAGLAQLGGLPRLELLWLEGTRVTDAGLERLADLTNLRHLNLAGTGVGDAGMRHLARLDRLETMQLNGTQVGDASVPMLARLGRLQYLSLGQSRMSPEAIDALKAAHPAAKIR